MMKKLAIFLPGFLDSKDYAHLVDLDRKLTELGYVVERVNPTGTWEENADISKYLMTQYLADIESVVNKYDDVDEILIGGHSLGGEIALLYASRNPEVDTAIGIMAPATFMRDEDSEKTKKWRETGMRHSIRDLPNGNATREFEIPYSFAEDSIKYDVTKEIANFHGNLLLIAGELDDVVVPDQLREIYAAANEPKELKIMEDIGHNYRHNENEIGIVNREIINFLEKHEN